MLDIISYDEIGDGTNCTVVGDPKTRHVYAIGHFPQLPPSDRYVVLTYDPATPDWRKAIQPITDKKNLIAAFPDFKHAFAFLEQYCQQPPQE